jgi:2-phosphosulfolactate phosphatase
MWPAIQVHLLPGLIEPSVLRSATVVVVDVLRATTTMVQALAAGAMQVIPCAEVDEAQSRMAALATAAVPGAHGGCHLPVGTPTQPNRSPPAMALEDGLAGSRSASGTHRGCPTAVLGGERGGVRIAGFQLGNSPREYVASVVAGRTIVMTTTNGTRAVLHASTAARVLIGAFTNLGAVCDIVRGSELVHIVCAGTNGQIARDDALLAGAILDRTAPARPRAVAANDAAALCRQAWRHLDPRRLADELKLTQAASHLIQLGLESDIDDAARLDQHRLVPEFCASDGAIRVP